MSTAPHTAVDFLVHLSVTLTSPGLIALLSFSRHPPDSMGLLPAVIVSTCLAVAVFFLLHNPAKRKALPLVCLANLTFGLIITMSVFLNIMAQLCPPQGRELALIPLYVLICASRIGPSMMAYAVQGAISLALAVVFVVVKADKSARPGGEETSDPEIGESLDALHVFEILTCTFYACTPQLTGVFDWLRVSTGPEWVWVESKNGWFLHTGIGIGAAATVARGLLLIFLFTSGDSVVYNFLYPKAGPVPHYCMVLYSILLAFASMQMAACWFNALRNCIEDITGSAYTASKLVRMQHILFALLVASAWIYPLQLTSLRVIAVVILLTLNLSL